jgi:hypothetical protein
MKKIMLFFLALFSLQAIACPDLTGTYKDEDDNIISITQTNCEKTIWSDSESSTTLIADNIERVVQQEGGNIAYGKARFTDVDFILELRAVYSGNVPTDFPTHFITSYRIDKSRNMVEKVESTQGISYVTFRRIK